MDLMQQWIYCFKSILMNPYESSLKSVSGACLSLYFFFLKRLMDLFYSYSRCTVSTQCLQPFRAVSAESLFRIENVSPVLLYYIWNNNEGRPEKQDGSIEVHFQGTIEKSIMYIPFSRNVSFLSFSINCEFLFKNSDQSIIKYALCT